MQAGQNTLLVQLELCKQSLVEVQSGLPLFVAWSLMR